MRLEFLHPGRLHLPTENLFLPRFGLLLEVRIESVLQNGLLRVEDFVQLFAFDQGLGLSFDGRLHAVS